jgi:hypothetical protein
MELNNKLNFWLLFVQTNVVPISVNNFVYM